MSDLEEKRIKFPSKHYVGFRDDNSKTGFMTPHGTDSAARKRMSTVDSWVKSSLTTYDWKTKEYIKVDVKRPQEILDNVAMSGFEIENKINRSDSWNKCTDRWKITDPRGFQVEITSGNLLKIIQHSSIENGVIAQDCIWARLGSENILVPVNTEIYKNAFKNTERANKSTSLKDLHLGDYVIMQNGKEGYYQGKYYLIEDTFDSSRLKTYKMNDKKRWIFLDKDGSFFWIASPKISSITDENKLMEMDEINNLLSIKKEIWSNYWRRSTVSGFTLDGIALSDKFGDVKHVFIEKSGKLEDYPEYSLSLDKIDENKYNTSDNLLIDKNLYYYTESPRPYVNYRIQVKSEYRHNPESFYVINFEYETTSGTKLYNSEK